MSAIVGTGWRHGAWTVIGVCDDDRVRARCDCGNVEEHDVAALRCLPDGCATCRASAQMARAEAELDPDRWL